MARKKQMKPQKTKVSNQNKGMESTIKSTSHLEKTLKNLLADMQDKVSKAGHGFDVVSRIKLIKDATNAYNSEMEKLSKVYKTKDETIEKLKKQLRGVYDKAQIMRDRYIDLHDEKLNKIFKQLGDKINTIEKHKKPEAFDTAQMLLDNLKSAKETMMKNLRTPQRNEQKDIDVFLKTCKESINKALPILEKDLGWGDFLKNILKSIANAVISVATIGNKKNFFKLATTPSSEAVKDADKDLGTSMNKPS